MSDINMEQLHEDITKVRETQAIQGQMLTTIMQQFDALTRASTLQSTQIGVLTTEISVLKNEVSTIRNELININSWRADAPNLYIPRKEQDAQRHEQRISELEDRMNAKSVEQFDFLKWIVDHGMTIALFAITVIITLYNTFHH